MISTDSLCPSSYPPNPPRRYKIVLNPHISKHVDTPHKALLMAERDRMIGAKEAARYLGISLNTLYRMEKAGLLFPYRTPGGHRRYSLAMLDEYLEQSRSPR